MKVMTDALVTTQVHRIYIKATPQAIWDAITKPEWNQRYGYRAASHYELRKGGKYQVLASEGMKAHGSPAVIIDGEVIEADPPRKLVQSWRALWSPELAAEEHTRVTWDIEEDDGGFTRVTVTHELEGAPQHAAMIGTNVRLHEGGGAWPWILSDLKTLLETGKESQA